MPDSLKQENLRRGGKKKVLLLGSGLVAGPAVDVFAARPDVHLIIGEPFPFSIHRSTLI